MSYTLLKEPYTIKQIRELSDEDGYISGVVSVDISDVIDGYEYFLDVISERLVDSELLTDIVYEVVGFGNGNILHIRVEGCVDDILNEHVWDEEEEDVLLTQSVDNTVRFIVQSKVANGLAFTAWDVTQIAHQLGVKEPHRELKQVVHSMYDCGEMLGYQRQLRDMGGPVPAWYYFNQSDYASQSFTGTNVPVVSDDVARDEAEDKTLGDNKLFAKADKRQTICVPAVAVRTVGFKPGTSVAVVSNHQAQTLHILELKDYLTNVPANKMPYRVYTVDKDRNIRITKSAQDDAWAWASTFEVICNEDLQEILLTPLTN